MIFAFALSCFVMALVYVGGLLVYKRNGPSDFIGRVSNTSVSLYIFHLLLALGALAVMLLQGDSTALAVSAAILASPFILASSFSFRHAGWAMWLQILVLTTGGLWLTVSR